MRERLTSLAASFGVLAIVLLTAVWVDVSIAEPHAVWFLLGGLVFLLGAYALVDIAAALIPFPKLRSAPLQALAVAIVVVPALILATSRLTRGALEGDLNRLWIILGAGAAGGIVAFLLRRRLGVRDSPRHDLAMLAGAGYLSVLLMYIHLREGTLAGMHERSTGEHMLLYLGSLGASLALLPGFAMRIVARTEAPASSGYVIFWGVVCFGIGAAMLVADRIAFVGLHWAVHMWLEILGLIALDSAMVLAWRQTRADPAPTPSFRNFAAVVVLGLAFATYFLPGPLTNIRLRASIGDSPFAALIVRSHPAHRPGALLPKDVFDHPALAYELAHDQAEDLGFNIVIVSVDALRGDVLDDIDEPIPEVENMAALARESAYFRRAYAPGSRTALSMSSFLAGKYSANLDWELWVAKKSLPLMPRSEWEGEVGPGYGHTTFAKPTPGGSMAERIEAQDIYTLAVPYGGGTAFFKKGVGFERGFRRYAEIRRGSLGLPSSRKVVRHAFRHLKRVRKKRFVMWVHMFDPHSAKKKWPRYLELVQAVDLAMGDLIAGLKEQGIWDDTVLVLLADHGEAFGDHGGNGHATTLYDEQVRVPLLIRVPGMAPQRVETPVSTIDAAATMVALSGGDLTGMDGVNLTPVIAGAEPVERPVFTELHRYLRASGNRNADLKGVVIGCEKLIYNRRLDELRLFDLCEDPKERENLVAERPERTIEMLQIIAAFVNRGESEHPLP